MSLIGIIFEVVGRSTVHSDLRSDERVRHNGAGAAAALPCVKTVPDSCLGYEPRAVLLNSRLQVNARRSTRRDSRQRALPTPPTSSRRRAATADAPPSPTRCPCSVRSAVIFPVCLLKTTHATLRSSCGRPRSCASIPCTHVRIPGRRADSSSTAAAARALPPSPPSPSLLPTRCHRRRRALLPPPTSSRRRAAAADALPALPALPAHRLRRPCRRSQRHSHRRRRRRRRHRHLRRPVSDLGKMG